MVISGATKHGGKCVVINLTDSSHAPNSFTLKPGQHRYIYKDSDVNFGDAFLTSEDRLQKECSIGSAKPHEPMDLGIVAEIVKRAVGPPRHPAIEPYLLRYL